VEINKIALKHRTTETPE